MSPALVEPVPTMGTEVDDLLDLAHDVAQLLGRGHAGAEDRLGLGDRVLTVVPYGRRGDRSGANARLDHLAKLAGLPSSKGLQDLRYVAHCFPPEHRRCGVPWSAYRLLCARPDRHALLERLLADDGRVALAWVQQVVGRTAIRLAPAPIVEPEPTAAWWAGLDLPVLAVRALKLAVNGCCSIDTLRNGRTPPDIDLYVARAALLGVLDSRPGDRVATLAVGLVAVLTSSSWAATAKSMAQTAKTERRSELERARREQEWWDNAAGPLDDDLAAIEAWDDDLGD